MLRAATRAAHDRVDALFGDLNLGRAADYRHFLTAQAAAFLPVEAALDAQGVAASFPGWGERRRADLLRADLDALGLAVPPPLPAPSLPSRAAVAGAAYVLEGSRLGGAMLARRVPAGVPRLFLGAAAPPGHWGAFLEQLEQVLQSDVERREAVAGAGRVFDLFARAAALPTEVS
jgi:heme oxygenase